MTTDTGQEEDAFQGRAGHLNGLLDVIDDIGSTATMIMQHHTLSN